MTRRPRWIWAAAAVLLALGGVAHAQTTNPAEGIVPHYYGPYPNYANSPLPVVDAQGQYLGGGIQKFVNGLPLPGSPLGTPVRNDLGQYIPLAIADATTYPGADYYEIAVVEYQRKLHRDLPPTKLRGYVQLSTSVVPGKRVALAQVDGSPILLPNGSQAYAVEEPQYLGPVISATKDKPVRILFRNLLPTGVKGNLFLPVDTTVMGAGMGPGMMGMEEPNPQQPMCGEIPKPAECYTENRATLHLHGGLTPWISDGTPHQWITPASETTQYPKGVSVHNVPDMPDPGPGAQTFFYTNQQSARLMFYHDHSWGITRLNVYAGEAAPYLITDDAEQRLLAGNFIPGADATIPLVVQDKTFVPGTAQLAQQDPLWAVARWGGEGSLWVPHVYMPAQNPGSTSGANDFGRWAYGPWFWPPTSQVKYGEIPNPFYDPACSDVICPEAPTIPGVPYLSMGMEAFNDTPVVNGTVYPTTTLEPKPYRFRILNAANDRFFNLQFYLADATGTEVALNAAEVAAAIDDPQGVFPTPDTALSPPGPAWLQIGTEGGFLPAPAVVNNQVITWVTDPTVFNAGNVDKHSLLLGPAERADVIVDFTPYAGRTLILYNDAPAAFPARDARYDYYTGAGDLTWMGGAPPIIPGYGPNTRTVMQIKIAGTPSATPPPANHVNTAILAALQTEFAHKADGTGVFESSQNPIIVGQGAYNSAYGSTFRSTAPRDGFVRITDFSFSFNTLLHQGATDLVTMPLQPKAIQDEMGEAFEHEYGRMSGNLGLEAPSAQAGAQNLILYPYVNPASEMMTGISLPVGQMKVTPFASTSDGTQVWKITHNGVDTHPIHFHLFDVQLVNRVGWDGIIRPPEATELGWKDTVRVSPLEDTIVAMRPILPKQPFGVPDSVRLLNPMMPEHSTAMFNNVDTNGDPITPGLTNELTNFGWEYVWHCHILSHEEMDMMRPISVSAPRAPSPAPVGFAASGNPGSPVTLTWTDPTPVTTSATTWGDPRAEVGYRVERATGTGAFATVGTALANANRFVDTTTVAGSTYRYRVVAYNAAGDSPSAVVQVPLTPPAAPTNVTASVSGTDRVTVSWRDASFNETSFRVFRSTNGAAFVGLTPIARTEPGTSATGQTVTFNDTVVLGNSYRYYVEARNAAGAANSSTVTVDYSLPAAPSAFTASAVKTSTTTARVTLQWRDNANNETGFTIQRATSSAFTSPTSTTVGANTTSTTQNLTSGVTYWFRIRANNAVGSSAWVTTSITTP